MKISYVGNFSPEFSTENDVRLAFEHVGHEVRMLQENGTHWQTVREAALQSDLLLWTGTWDDAQPLAETIETLRLCAMAGIPTATLHLDIFHGLSRDGRKWWLHPMFFTRFVFTADGSHQDDWKRMGIDHYWLRPGVRHTAVHPGKVRPEYQCDVAFVGSNGIGYHEDVWPYRRELVEKLREICQRRGWSFLNPGGYDPKIDRGEDLNDFYASAKVTVGDSLCLGREKSLYCSDRVYEATGRGGLLIMPKLNFLERDFDRSLPSYAWGDWAHLEACIDASLIPEFNQGVRRDCQALTAKRHTYVARVEEMLGVMTSQGAWQ